MSRKLTMKQKAFADNYLETGNGKLSVIEANYEVSTDESARSMASQNLTKPKVIEYLQSKAQKAAEIVFSIAQYGDTDTVRLSASKDILDRTEGKAVERNINYNAQVNIIIPASAARKYGIKGKDVA